MKKLNAILIIDDDDICSFLTMKTLEKASFATKIITARNGLEGLRKISEYSLKENLCPELVITDMEMPVMDGIEFIDSFRQMNFVNKESITIIANSSTLSEPHRIKLDSIGVKTYIQKPLDTQAIQEVISLLKNSNVLKSA